MSEAISSFRTARDQLRAEAAGVTQRDATTYPDGVVAAAVYEAGSASEPGLFDRSFYVHSIATGSTDVNAFGGPFSDVYDRSAAELDSEDFSITENCYGGFLGSRICFPGSNTCQNG